MPHTELAMIRSASLRLHTQAPPSQCATRAPRGTTRVSLILPTALRIKSTWRHFAQRAIYAQHGADHAPHNPPYTRTYSHKSARRCTGDYCIFYLYHKK